MTSEQLGGVTGTVSDDTDHLCAAMDEFLDQAKELTQLLEDPEDPKDQNADEGSSADDADPDPSAPSDAGQQEEEENVPDPETEQKEKLAKACKFFYKRMRRQAPDKMPAGIDQGPSIGFRYFFGMKLEELKQTHEYLERVCYEHAEPIDSRTKRMCLTAIKRVGDAKNREELEKLTADQQQLVQEALATSDERERLRVIGHRTLSFAKEFLRATGGNADTSRQSFLEAVATHQQLTPSSDEGTSTTGESDEHRPALPVVDPKLAEQFRVTGQELAEKGRQQAHQQQERKKHMEALERERDKLKQQNEDLSRQVTDLTEERDTLAAEKKTAEEQIAELEGQFSKAEALVKDVGDAWTAAFAAVAGAKTLSPEAVEALKHHVAALEKAQKQAEEERDTARRERDGIQENLDERPTTAQLASVKRWRVGLWVACSVLAVSCLIATVSAITGWSAQREAAQRAQEYYQAWQATQ